MRAHDPQTVRAEGRWPDSLSIRKGIAVVDDVGRKEDVVDGPWGYIEGQRLGVEHVQERGRPAGMPFVLAVPNGFLIYAFFGCASVYFGFV